MTALLTVLLLLPAPASAARPRTPTVLVDGMVTAVHPSGEDARHRHYLAEVRVLRERRGRTPARLFMKVLIDKEPRIRGRRDVPLEPGQLFRGLLIPLRRSLYRQATYGIADVPEIEDADTDLGSVGGVKFATAPWDDGLHRSQEFNFERYFLPVSTAAATEEGATLTVTFAGDLLGPRPMRHVDIWGHALAPRKGAFPPTECGATKAGWRFCLSRKDGKWDGGYWGDVSDDYSVLGAIVSGPKGAVLFRLFGPRATVSAHEKDFRATIDGLEAAPEPPPITEPSVEPEPADEGVDSSTEPAAVEAPEPEMALPDED